ncbi:DHA2 family efflux MFS transporter permease subunit [Cryptosporangium minutisporangium]|uniref:DHA2 family efflux MFS transporter permease subunit n=1 Tax=Cryptosporangium minutisporangium TaxID=113569 RepID=A0ABP6SZ55_9ACTN
MLGALVLCVLVLGLDLTILNVALPTIAGDLAVGTGGLQWVVNAYVLVFAGLMLPAGALGDRYGRRRLLLAGLVVFGGACLAATWAESVAVLVALRAVMGAGAAIIMPIVLAVLAVLFDERERGKALSVVVVAIGAGLPLGPIVGGWLLQHYWWGSIFLINVPIAAAAGALIAVLMPESKDPRPPRADLPGAVLSTAGLVGLVYGIVEAPGRGWTDPLVLGMSAAGIGLLAGFVVWELRAAAPMIDLRLFADAQFAWGTVGATLASFALFGLLFTLPQYLQLVEGADAFGTGLRLLPLIGGIVLGAPIAQSLAARAGYRTPVAAGLLLAAAGLAAGATTDVGTGYGFVAAWLTLTGFGAGMSLTPAMDAVLGVLPPERAGSGTALTMALRQVAGAFGVALLGSLLAAGYSSRLDTTGLPSPAAHAADESVAAARALAARTGNTALAANASDAFVHGMALALGAAAVVALLGAVLTAVFLPGRPTPTGQVTQPGAHPEAVA